MESVESDVGCFEVNREPVELSKESI